MSHYVTLSPVDLDMLDRAIRDLEAHYPSSRGLPELKRVFTHATETLDHPAGFAARESWGITSDELEVDGNPAVSEGEDGAWVSAYVWVSKEDWGTFEEPEL
jgi:hypothetical protein